MDFTTHTHVAVDHGQDPAAKGLDFPGAHGSTVHRDTYEYRDRTSYLRVSADPSITRTHKYLQVSLQTQNYQSTQGYATVEANIMHQTGISPVVSPLRFWMPESSSVTAETAFCWLRIVKLAVICSVAFNLTPSRLKLETIYLYIFSSYEWPSRSGSSLNCDSFSD
jgi:hypothetical protein